MGNEGRGTVPDSSVEGMLMEAASGEPATRHRSGRMGSTDDQAAARVDAVAGSEFLDDRLDFG